MHFCNSTYESLKEQNDTELENSQHQFYPQESFELNLSGVSLSLKCSFVPGTSHQPICLAICRSNCQSHLGCKELRINHSHLLLLRLQVCGLVMILHHTTGFLFQLLSFLKFILYVIKDFKAVSCKLVPLY